MRLQASGKTVDIKFAWVKAFVQADYVNGLNSHEYVSIELWDTIYSPTVMLFYAVLTVTTQIAQQIQNGDLFFWFLHQKELLNINEH